MATLGKVSGAAFDRMWLTMVISHDEGASVMAQTELAHGQDAASKALVRSIITGQSAEIVTMRSMLAAL